MNINSVPELIIYTDGSCKSNPGPGGWAAILIDASGAEQIISGKEDHTTNNRMELLSVINALSLLVDPCKINLYTDSQYVQQGITTWLPKWLRNNWITASGGVVKNIDLWEKLLFVSKRHIITWKWVKAHNGDLLNERVDYLAKKAIGCGK